MKKRKVLAFDLETIADPTCIPFLSEPKPHGQIKNPVKIAADIKKKKQKQILDMGLDPATNLICCAAFCDGGKPQSISIMIDAHEAEKTLLESLWNVLSKYNHFVTFNGRAFDLRCIHLHGITHGIRPSVNIDKGRYNKGNHTDIREILAGPSDFAKGKLDFFCQKFLGKTKTEGMDGSQVQSYFEMGLHDDIAKYAEQDAKLTWELYKKVEDAGLLD